MGAKPATAGASEAWSLDDHWPELVAGLAEQFTENVSSLQNQIDQLLAKGRINKLEHRALSVPAERIKLAGVSAQQINRFYSGRIRQSHEKVDMAQLVEGVLQERKQELGTLGIALRRKLKQVEVLIDPTVAHTFVNAVLDWGLPFGNRVDMRLDLNAWPQHARLQMRVANDGVPPSSAASTDSLSWMLIRQIALVSGGVEIEREVNEEGVSFTAMFTRTVQAVDGISAVDLSDEHSSMFKSLSGTYVLTISPSLQIRADVRDALREIGISSDSVVDFQQARDALKSRMPSLIVVDSEIKDDDFDAFRRDLLREVFEFPFVEISPDDSSFDMSGFGEFSMAKVGRGNIREALGTAVMFELAKMM
ncbi:MAG TPA: hypothetical protein DCY64_03185 [Hydrogenophaga sp.]|uniref:hypothetical protein n=1 Tax=Hydrogenophaga sp. TaxID=1904254 RepID=UPI0008D22BDE|nr:hypothetical protein [Hydrogenophaga sp.]OGA78232.1 MAG: hypothetical protein A2X73_09250 [Burkholderiales bacterium GWE1_65_30]OGA93155.1 MAG: hypothetical protein A2X72_08500 [Burkholderiales bacterium GWF1_66_17]OGB35422.1 MAG: hypothetical protein A3I16_08805 [Burkholderiales bacterium RIFCSPLOWO2_02_FULL_66_35]MDO9030821.1 hypothetical protein [Hydrogenophaga sp.]MDP2023650.1 hypothetical protein [Hydrogenophaga sp.]